MDTPALALTEVIFIMHSYSQTAKGASTSQNVSKLQSLFPWRAR